MGSRSPSHTTYPAFIGYAILFTFETVLILELYPVSGYNFGTLGKAVINATVCVAGIFTALNSEKIYPLCSRRWLAETATLAQIVIALFMLHGGQAMQPLVAAGCTVALGFCYVCLQLSWYELFSRLEASSAFFHFAIANMLSAIAITTISAAGVHWPITGMWATLPIASLLCLRKARTRVDSETAATPSGEQVANDWTFPLKPVILLALFTFTNISVRSFMVPGTQGFAALGVFLALIIPAVLAFRGTVPEMPTMFGLSFTLMVAGTLSLLFDNRVLSDLGALCANGAFAILGLSVFSIFCRASFRYGVNPLWLFGFQSAAEYGGKALSQASQSLLHQTLDTTAFSVVIVMILVITFTVTITDYRLTASFDIVQKREAPTASGLTPLDITIGRCATLARRYNLTRREEEVLFYLAQGTEIPDIASKFCLAESTVSSHIKHIYAKTSTHSRSELIELVNTCRAI